MFRPEIAERGRFWTISIFIVMECGEFATFANGTASLMQKKLKRRTEFMAKPIKETPILYDEDAYRFEMAAQHVVPLPEEEREAIWKAYEGVRSWCAPGVL